MTTTLSTPSRAARKVPLASFVGTTVEWYDFFIYSTAAALVFSTEFFPGADPTAGRLLSFATLGIGFLARPFGGVVAGHFGDRLGRKKTLVVTLMIMGLATAAIGVLPGYSTIGIWAPILLVVLRLVQGISAGGEWGGAALMGVEHAPTDKRGRYGASTQLGTPAGLILATGVFFLVQSFTTTEQFLAWGWRLPFLFSIVLIVVGVVIRLRIEESPVFAAVEQSGTKAQMPIAGVFRRHPRSLVIAALSFVGTNAIGYIFLSYLLSYSTTELGLDRSTPLVLTVIGSVVWFVFTLAAGAWSDRYGRRRLYLIGYSLMIVWAFPFFALVNTASWVPMIIAVAVLCVGLGLAYGPQCAFFAEVFDADIRYSGVSLAYSIGAVLGGGFAPLIATALVAGTGTAYSVSAYMVVVAGVSLTAMLFVRESDLVLARERDAAERAVEPAA